MKPVLVKTFGCKVNYAESTEFSTYLRAQGVPTDEYSHGIDSTVVLVNTCCVTAEAGRKALQFIRKLRREKPNLSIAATGCGARLPELKERMTNAGAETFDSYTALLNWLRETIKVHDDSTKRASVQSDQESILDKYSNTTSRVRGFIKVQDGCGCRCSYCIIPFVRPRSSRPITEVLELVDQAIIFGQHELVLTGVNLGAYGREQPLSPEKRIARAAPLIELVEQILHRLPARTRLRLSSIEPQDVDKPLLELFTHPQLCPHLHLPLQSGSESVLREMRRRYTAAQYLRAVEQFRILVPHGSVTTDILVGYPTESREDFADTLALCSSARFERVHGFPFSSRPCTHAATLHPLPPGTATARNRELIDTCSSIADQAWSRFDGDTCQVLVEEPARGGGMLGHGPAYQIVVLPEGKPGEIVDTQLVRYSNGRFHGQSIN